jgi:MoaA/NifB/PqqE/SkfB family radical SAM enzyme
MSQIAFNYQQLNMLLRVFFATNLKVALKNPRSAWAFIRTLFGLKQAARKRRTMERLGVRVPPILILSITERCNLACKGCYAHALHEAPADELSPDRLRRLVAEADQLGISFFVVAGGEPFMKPELLEMAEAHRNIIFLVFTNGLLIDKTMTDRLRRLPNIVPLLSLEGGEKETDERRGAGVYRKLLAVMADLKRNNIFFGTSLTITRANFPVLTDELFVRGLVSRGMRLILTVEFTPVDEGTEELTVTPEQRQAYREKVARYRRTIPAVFVNLPQDEEDAGGCLAAGRGFVHVSAKGAVEPCPFSPFSDSNLNLMSLEQALQSKFLARLRAHPAALHETGGGCVLWQKREWVTELLREISIKDEDAAILEKAVSSL